jgi:pimeloyl-ACP methyl ester carboxylesterase
VQCTALVLPQTPHDCRVFFFACNKSVQKNEFYQHSAALSRHVKIIRAISTSTNLTSFEAVGLMQRTQPNYSVDDLAQIRVPVAIVQSEHDEFIKREHAEYLARSIPNADYIYLPGVSHFAPLQRPEQFNTAVFGFLSKVLG